MKTCSFKQLLEEHKVVIPIIQRDYAQGRTCGKAPKIREKFLNDIFKSLEKVEGKPLELDFIYGYSNIQKNKREKEFSVFTPLDGQQRLTTLFLLHWFIAVKEVEQPETANFLKSFSYATRHSSRLFCEQLVNFWPKECGESISETIVEQSWFFSAWKNDPTVKSMLVMLDAIQRKYNDKDSYWALLTGDSPRIYFHLLPMDKLGLQDDLYIKMNSRGKELTDFEHFKARFAEVLPDYYAKIFEAKIDKEWADLFWATFKETKSSDIAKVIDAGFLGFFWYITDILSIKQGVKKNDNGFLGQIYGDEENVKFLFSCLDLFCTISSQEANYFEDLFYLNAYESGKCRLFFQNAQVNLFKKCCETYGYDEIQNSFSIGEQLLLYACILNKLHGTDDFNIRVRKLRNLLSSSEFQLRKENLDSLYKDVEAIVSDKEIPSDSKLSKTQIAEEDNKRRFIFENPGFSEIIYNLEDHNLLRGTIAIFYLNEQLKEYAMCFDTVFYPNCDYFEISKAMLTFGDYSQTAKGLKIFGNGTHSTWRELFSPNESRKNFNNTKDVLKSYLSALIENSDLTNKQIIDEYNATYDNNLEKSKSWIYYYIRYENFTKWQNCQTYGFYSWNDITNKPYECYMMFRAQFNGRHWNPFLLEISVIHSECNINNYGNDLQYASNGIILYVSCLNHGFKFYAPQGEDSSSEYVSNLIFNHELDEHGVLLVPQNENGLDLVDRIKFCQGFLNNITNKLSSNHTGDIEN